MNYLQIKDRHLNYLITTGLKNFSTDLFTECADQNLSETTFQSTRFQNA